MTNYSETVDLTAAPSANFNRASAGYSDDILRSYGLRVRSASSSGTLTVHVPKQGSSEGSYSR